MSYLSLARKYRPSRFSDLIAQEAVSLVLTQSIKLGRAPQAVIFSGTRGIGKTTAARIYAMALNCDRPQIPGEPCGSCSSCQAVKDGIHEDVYEIDGASHTGVDDIRSIQEGIGYACQRSRYKIYIIDEVHMLSTSAFNALLKTLEEPPSYVVFVFATTEIHKVPETVLGRCQSFYLKKIPLTSIMERIRWILAEEHISSDSDAIRLVALQGQGSMRDALTFLDQAIALGNGALKKEIITEYLGRASSEKLFELLKALIRRDPSRSLEIISFLSKEGISFDDAASDLAKLARLGSIVFALQNSKNPTHLQPSDLWDADPILIEQLTELAKEIRPLDFSRIFRSFVQCTKDQDGSDLDALIFENYCLEWCLDPGLPTIASLKEAFNQKQPAAAFQNFSAPSLSEQKIDFKNPLEAKKSETKKPEPSHSPLTESWRKILDAVKKAKPISARLLEDLHPLTLTSSQVVLGRTSEAMLESNSFERDVKKVLMQELQNQLGFTGSINFVSLKEKDLEEKGLKETIFTTKIKEQQLQQDHATKSLLEHPLTKTLVDCFDSKIAELAVE